MCAATAMAIYGTQKITAEKALELGLAFFSDIELAVTISGYYKYRKDRSEEDIDFIEVSLDDLKSEILAKNATSFRLYCENNSGELWDASFGYSTTQFGGFYNIDAQCASHTFSGKKFSEYIERTCNSTDFKYAIFFEPDDVSDGFYYAQGGNLVSIYNYENPALFSRETGGRFRGAERFNGDMLRMVYLSNVLNEKHVSMNINGVSLQDWILSDNGRGTLSAIANGMWIWEVEREQLDSINKTLGGLGVLISYKSLRVPKPTRFLP